MLEQIDRRVPALAVFFTAFAAVAVALVFLKGLQDPDYFWHLRTGQLILRSGLPSSDPFSFTYGGPWTLHEWLGQVLIAALDWSLGASASLAVFALLGAAPFVVMGSTLRTLGSRVGSVVVAALLCGAVAIPYATVRPQVISWLLLAVLLTVLLVARSDRRAPLFALPLLFVLWANVHGLYVIGLGVLGLFVAATFFGKTDFTRVTVVAVFVACLLASAATPSGLEGLTYPLRYVEAGDWGLANIPEWQSPNFHDLIQIPLLVLISAVVLLRRPTTHVWLQAGVILAIIGALLANRNAPVAAVVAFPYLVFALDAHPATARRSPVGARTVQLVAAAAVVVGSATTLPGTVGWRGVTLDRYPAAAVALMVDIAPDARVVAEYGWAGFVIDRLYHSGTRVFVDGRNDMYPETILRDYTAIRTADQEWRDLLVAWKVDALLFPPDAPVVRGIAQANGWCEAFRDERQVLLLRTCPAS